jgi:hypothetical protein
LCACLWHLRACARPEVETRPEVDIVLFLYHARARCTHARFTHARKYACGVCEGEREREINRVYACGVCARSRTHKNRARARTRALRARLSRARPRACAACSESNQSIASLRVVPGRARAAAPSAARRIAAAIAEAVVRDATIMLQQSCNIHDRPARYRPLGRHGPSRLARIVTGQKAFTGPDTYRLPQKEPRGGPCHGPVHEAPRCGGGGGGGGCGGPRRS